MQKLFFKQIGDQYYYVVEAVPQTKKKTLQIVSAFINKNKKAEGSYLTDAKSPDATPDDVGMTPSVNTTVPQNGTGVNSYDMQNGGENSQFSFGGVNRTDINVPYEGEAETREDDPRKQRIFSKSNRSY